MIALDAAAREALLLAARDAIHAHVDRRAQLRHAVELEPPLSLSHPCFVTLRSSNHALRGCIGRFHATGSLAEESRSMAVAAATRDPRFAPVSRDEAPSLRMSVTVLGPTFAIRADEIHVGVHGLVISRGAMRGVLLPQVATENGWDRETFLAQTSRKASLPEDAWRDPSTRIEAFTAIHVGE